MIDLKFLREHQDIVERGVKAKGYAVDIAEILRLDQTKRELQTRVETTAAKKNAASSVIVGTSGPERETLLAELRALDDSVKEEERRLKEMEEKLESLLGDVPNLPSPDVKEGGSDSENEVIRQWGEPSSFGFQPKTSWELGAALSVFDTERGAKVAGSRFGYLTGPGVRLELALMQLAFQTLETEDFIPVFPPVLIKSGPMEGMGYTLHGGREETYYLERDDQYLVGTAEQSIGPMLMDEALTESDLPKRYVGFSTCFRREAGSYGKDVKGIFRVHQFDKVEMFSFTAPEQSDAEHEKFLALEEQLLQSLGLPYQVVKMCTGDLGVPAARKYDLEAWFPGEGRYRELTSTSTCTDWQARRLNIRYRPKAGGALRFVHTLNGTAFAMGRTICAILENYQQADGSVTVPDVLQTLAGIARIAPRK